MHDHICTVCCENHLNKFSVKGFPEHVLTNREKIPFPTNQHEGIVVKEFVFLVTKQFTKRYNKYKFTIAKVLSVTLVLHKFSDFSDFPDFS